MLSSDEGGGVSAGSQLGLEQPPRDGGCGGDDPSPYSPALSTLELKMKNLELIHHFTTATYATLSTEGDAREVWRMVIPRIAFSHEFVMHALLAMSALHLSFLKPTDKSYAVVAARHHVNALGLLRTAFSELRPQLGDALYAASSLTAMYVYACPPVVDGMLPKAPTWIPVFRGILTTVQQCWDWVQRGELAPLSTRKEIDRSRYAGEDTKFPSSLYDLSRRGAPGEPDPKELEDDNVLVIYRNATEALKVSWDDFQSFDPRVAAAFRWPVNLSDEFAHFIKEQRPRALVLLAHHCVMLELLEEQFWWVKGRGVDEIRRIESVLGEKWKRWLDWPMARCKISNGAG